MSKQWLVALAVSAILGCSKDDEDKGSMIDPDKLLVELSEGEVAELCGWVVDTFGGPQTFECEDGSTITIGDITQDQCIAEMPSTATNPDCTATIGQFEACVKARKSSDPCTVDSPTQCAEIDVPECN